MSVSPTLHVEYSYPSLNSATLVHQSAKLQVDVTDGYLDFTNPYGVKTRFTVAQFHFHTSSEHTINGRSYSLEMHIVHTDGNGNYAVIGFMFDAGPDVDNCFLHELKVDQANTASI